MVHRYINFNELLWNYEIIITFFIKIRLLTIILYYETSEPSGIHEIFVHTCTLRKLIV